MSNLYVIRFGDPPRYVSGIWYGSRHNDGRWYGPDVREPAHARKFERLGWKQDSKGEWQGNGKSVTIRRLAAKTSKKVRSATQLKASQALGRRKKP